jgi:uncharacterized membrane protein YidH (DUF202 family)
MSVRSALRAWTRSALYVLSFVLGIVLLVLFLVFGAIVAVVYRNRRAGFSYFASVDDAPKDEAGQDF